MLELFKDAKDWGIPRLEAKHLPRIARALGILVEHPVESNATQTDDLATQQGQAHRAKKNQAPWSINFAEILGIRDASELKRTGDGLVILDGYKIFPEGARAPWMYSVLLSFTEWAGVDMCAVSYPDYVNPTEGSFQSFCGARKSGYSMARHVFSRHPFKEARRQASKTAPCTSSLKGESS